MAKNVRGKKLLCLLKKYLLQLLAFPLELALGMQMVGFPPICTFLKIDQILQKFYLLPLLQSLQLLISEKDCIQQLIRL